MPFLKITTNQTLDDTTRATLLGEASARVAEALGKPERYVMVELADGRPMLFAGDDAPLAYLELKSIGLPEGATPALSDALCDLVGERLGIPADRVYIEFSNAARHLWGWNGTTF